MLPLDLLDTAELLLQSGRGKPTQASVRRAFSSIYYGLFHFVCRECADRLIGATVNCRNQRAWAQVYRALDHRDAKIRCKKIAKENDVLNFPIAIREVATLFATLQEKRHEADYDIRAQLTETDAFAYLATVRSAVVAFERAPIKHRRAFAAYILVKDR